MNENISPSKYGLEKLLAINFSDLDRSAPRKKNTARENNRNLQKTHLKRNRLQNQFLKNRSKKIFVSVFSKKIDYYSNLKEKVILKNCETLIV